MKKITASKRPTPMTRLAHARWVHTRTLALAAFVALCLLFPSCAAPVLTVAGPALGIAQYGTSTFARGISTTVFATDSQAIEDAVRAVVTDLHMTLRYDREDHDVQFLRVEDDRHTEIRFWVTRNTAKITSLEIRVGFWGDQPYSSLLLDQIKLRLAESAEPSPR